MYRQWVGIVMGFALAASTGCAVTFAKRSPWDVQRLAELGDELDQIRGLSTLQVGEAEQLRRVKRKLENRLSSSDVTIGFDERGVVTRFLEQVLFESGKAQLRRSAQPVLDHLAQILKEMPKQPVGIEGHTDNEPIKVSGWSGNQELSEARANAVTDYLVNTHQISADRFTVIGYGEIRPIASNDEAEGRRQNRRVEIVVLPASLERSYEAEAKRVTEGHTTFVK